MWLNVADVYDYKTRLYDPDLGRFQYTGQMWIAEAGLYHYKARAYHPGLGRFLQTDPIGYGDCLNLDPMPATIPSMRRIRRGWCSAPDPGSTYQWAPTARAAPHQPALEIAANFSAAAGVRDAVVPVLAVVAESDRYLEMSLRGQQMTTPVIKVIAIIAALAEAVLCLHKIRTTQGFCRRQNRLSSFSVFHPAALLVLGRFVRSEMAFHWTRLLRRLLWILRLQTCKLTSCPLRAPASGEASACLQNF